MSKVPTWVAGVAEAAVSVESDTGCWILDAGCAGAVAVTVVDPRHTKSKAVTSCRPASSIQYHSQ